MRLPGSAILEILDSDSGPTLYTAGFGADRSTIEPGSTYSVVANALLVETGPFDALREGAANGREVGSQVEALARYVDGLPRAIRLGELRTTGSDAVVGDELTAARWSASGAPGLLCPVYRRSPAGSTA